MPVSIRYEDDGRIVVWVFEGRWTWDEYYAERDTVNAHVLALPFPASMIVDMRHSNLLPQSMMTHARTASVASPENLACVVIVAASGVLRAFFNLFTQIYLATRKDQPLELHMVADMDAAYALVRRSQQSPQG